MNFDPRFAFFLLPGVWRGLVGFLIIPLTTHKLDPADFGLFALVTAFAGIATGISALGSSQILSTHLPVIKQKDGQELVSSIFILSLLIAIFFAIVSILIWPILEGKFPEIELTPNNLEWFIPTIVLLSIPWSLAAAVATITGGARSFATINVLETSATAAATLVAIYFYDHGVLSLFLGSAIGAGLSAACSVIYLRQYFCFRLKSRWLIESARVGAISLVGNLAERIQVLLERYALSTYIGLSTVGLYNHGQQYQGIARMGMKAWLNSLLPMALREARHSKPTFDRFQSIFPVSQFALGLVGVAMATLGLDLIKLLTHDKFTDSYLIASFLLIIVQIEYMARPAFLFLVAKGMYSDLQKSLVFSLVISMVLVFPMTSFFGLYGAVSTVFIQSVVYRFFIAYLAKKTVKMNSKDSVAIAGVFLTFISIVISWYFADTVAKRATVWVGISATLVVIFLFLRRPKVYQPIFR